VEDYPLAARQGEARHRGRLGLGGTGGVTVCHTAQRGVGVRRNTYPCTFL
jgi:hypothetical protein